MRAQVRFCVVFIVMLASVAAYFAYTSAHAQNSCVVQPKGAAAWYPGDGNANDIARANNGTPQGNVTFAAGHVGQAFAFNGSGFIKVNASPSLDVGAGSGLTIDAWIKPTSVNSSQPLVEWNNNSSNGYGAHFWISAGFNGVSPGNLWGNIIDTTGANHGIQSAGGLVAPNIYQHVALTYDKASGIAKLFLNGAVVATQNLGSFTPQTSYDLYFANRPTTNFFYTGALDEIDIFNRALNESEIQTTFNAGTSGKCKETRVQFEHGTYPAGEASGAYSVTVRRTGDTSGFSTVNYATSDGTARAGEDYTAASGTLTFAPGEQAKTVAIPVTRDEAAEADETLQVTLSDPANATLGSPSTAALTLFDTPAGAGRIILASGNSFSTALFAFNTDGTNSFRLTSFGAGHATHPSVARHTGTIAFEACGEYAPNATCGRGRRIYAMDADGSNVRRVTTDAGLTNAQFQEDTRPVISPDGTKVAFISGRPDASNDRPEAFVVSIDGTNLRQITTKQTLDQNNRSYAVGVAWSPDSSKLLVHAFRLERDDNGNQSFFLGSLYTYNADGSGERLLVRNMSNGFQGSIAIDWSPDGQHILYASKGGPFHVAFGYVIMNLQDTSESRFLSRIQLGNNQISGDFGSVRFSPDGLKIVYGISGPPDATSGGFGTTNVNTINIDGTNLTRVLNNPGGANEAKWWWHGQAIPQAARLELTPNPALAWQGRGEQLIPTLFDAQGGVIFRAAQWQPFGGDSPLSGRQCDEANFPNLPPGVTRCTGNVSPRTDQVGRLIGSSNNGEINWCATNAGVTGCTRVQNFNSVPVSVRATTPEASKRTGAPGVFTITRPGSDSLLVVTLSISGSARRDVDYSLRVSDNASLSGDTLTLPAGIGSVTLTVEPVGNSPRADDRTVIIGLLPDFSGTNAYSVNDRASFASVLIKEDRQLAPASCDPPRIAPPAGITAWLAGEGSAADIYGGADGTLQNGATFAPGKVGQAFSFDGVDDRVSLPSVTLGNQYSVELWVNPSRHVGLQHLVSNDRDSQNFGALYLNNTRLEYFHGGRSLVTSSSTAPLNTWTHVALVYDGSLTRLYTNGALVGTSAAHTSIFNNPVTLGFGSTARGNDNIFGGQLDEVTFYSRALTTEEVARIHSADSAGKCNPTIQQLPSLALTSVSPNKGGDKGSVTISVRGQNIARGATLSLKRAGQSDIRGDASISQDGTLARAIFDLRGKARGVWDVVVRNPNGTTATLPGAFTIVEGRNHKVWGKLIAEKTVRVRATRKMFFVYGNSGDADAYGVPMGIIFPKDSQVNLGFNVITHSQVPLFIDLPKKPEDDFAFKALPLFIPVIRAGETVTLSFEYTVQDQLCGPARARCLNYRISSWISSPWFNFVESPNGTAKPTVAPGSDLAALMGNNIRPLGEPSIADCLTTIAGTAAREALGALLPSDCAAAFGLVAFDSFTAVLSIVTASDAPSARSSTVSIGTLLYDAFNATANCAKDVNPELKALEALTKTIITLANDDNCREILSSVLISVVTSFDPNDKLGPEGFGAQRYVTGEDATAYAVFFENKPDASAPAQEVRVKDQLDVSKFDFDTFELGPITFGERIIVPPAGLSEWTTDVDLRPTKNLIVRINARLDKTTGIVTWRFASIDPATNQPIDDALGGFLPPNRTSPEGEGSVLFTVNFKPNLAAGTEVRNSARIFFDTNDPIDTPVWSNTIDATRPTSQVQPLAAQQPFASFDVRWAGEDTGAGIRGYTIFVSENGAQFRAWLTNTALTSARFVGRRGATYSFYSAATDGADNRELPRAVADTATQAGGKSARSFARRPRPSP